MNIVKEWLIGDRVSDLYLIYRFILFSDVKGLLNNLDISFYVVIFFKVFLIYVLYEI